MKPTVVTLVGGSHDGETHWIHEGDAMRFIRGEKVEVYRRGENRRVFEFDVEQSALLTIEAGLAAKRRDNGEQTA